MSTFRRSPVGKKVEDDLYITEEYVEPKPKKKRKTSVGVWTLFFGIVSFALWCGTNDDPSMLPFATLATTVTIFLFVLTAGKAIIQGTIAVIEEAKRGQE